MTTYSWPGDNSRMRAVAITPWASGLLLPKWTEPPLLWRYTGGVLTSAAPALTSPYGFGGAVSDGASGVYLAQYSGSLVFYSSGGVATAYPLPAGNVYNGITYVPAYGQPYVVSSVGQVFAGTSATPIAGGGFPALTTWGLVSSGTTLFALASGGLGSCELTSPTLGIAGFIPYPFHVGMCLAASTAVSAVAVGGWDYFKLPNIYTAFAFASGNPTMVAVTSGAIDLWLGPNELWQRVQSIAVSGNPSAATWSPDGTHVLITDPTNGTVQHYTYTLGTLTLQQTLALAGAGQVAITPDGLSALVCRPLQNSVASYLLSGSIWVAGNSVSIGTPQSVLGLLASGAAVGCSSGIVYLTKTAGNWATSSVCSLAFNPSYMLSASGCVLAAGTATISGFFAAASGTSSLFTYSWVGNAAGMIDVEGQIVVSDSASPLFWTFGNLFTAYREVFTVLPNQAAFALAVSQTNPSAVGGTVFAAGSGSVSLYQFTTPYNVEPIRNGMVGIYGSGGWSTALLGSGHVPTAATFDVSGNVWVATLQNDLYEIDTSGNVLSQQMITQFGGQPQSTPLGVSAMAFLGSGLYGASSLAGPLVRLF